MVEINHSRPIFYKRVILFTTAMQLESGGLFPFGHEKVLIFIAMMYTFVFDPCRGRTCMPCRIFYKHATPLELHADDFTFPI